ncbi:glycosyltransferase [Rhodohalobacter halophilus]|uniref:glycosyltransferase n=1 Tax=Rhodohalobacter halophilus TaxID=1812810 RepID=UPI00083FB4E5|nr:glycosyltransferase family 2 protein [Rhodohalobacter halophilus]
MGITLLHYLLLAAFFYLIITSFILIRNRYELTELPNSSSEVEHSKFISVCIPARNEEMNIGNLLSTVLKQNYPNYEVIVLDDQSTDATPQIIDQFKKQYPKKLTSYTGKPKPDDWLGKPWACHQLGQHATGDLLLFLDADTQLEKDALEKVAAGFSVYNLDMLTVWPRQELVTFWEKTVIPLVYFALITLLPTIYVYRKPRWMPDLFYQSIRDKFAAANGQCVAFKKSSYQAIGGHTSVKNEVVEDVALARNIKKAGLQMRMFTGLNSIWCRMYQSHEEMFEGFRKNFLAGFGNSLLLFTLAGLLHFLVFILPFAVLFGQLYFYNPLLFFLSAAAVSIIFLQRFLVSQWFQWDPLYVFLHPIGVLWFQRLGITKIFDKLYQRSSTWKGRNV